MGTAVPPPKAAVAAADPAPVPAVAGPAAPAAPEKKKAPKKGAKAEPVAAAAEASSAEPKEQPIVASNGRFGPYLKWGTETRSLPATESPLTVTLAKALELFAQPKRGRGGAGGRGSAKVLKEVGKHPQGGADIRVLDGRFGPYVSDGTTNANVPKGTAPDALTLAEARRPAGRPRRQGPREEAPRRR